MHILIFEPNLSGHRINYLKIILHALKEEDKYYTTLLTLESLRKSSALETLKTQFSDSFDITYTKLSPLIQSIYAGHKLYNRELINYFIVRKHIKRIRVAVNYDLIFFPYLDNLARMLSLTNNPFFGIRFCGISMVPSFHYRKMGIKTPKAYFSSIKEKLFVRLLKNKYTKQILTIDQPMYEYISNAYPHLLARITYIPDPITFSGKEDKLTSRNYFHIPEHKNVILLYGSVSERKGVLELLRASAHKNFPENLMVVIAGVQTNQIKKEIQALGYSQEDVLFIDKYLTSKEEYMVFKSADLVWCGYKDFYGMSAVLIQAGAMKLPVISSNEGVVSWITERYETGKTINIQEEEQIINAIRLILEDQKIHHKFSENGYALSKIHAIGIFKEKIIDTLS